MQNGQQFTIPHRKKRQENELYRSGKKNKMLWKIKCLVAYIQRTAIYSLNEFYKKQKGKKL